MRSALADRHGLQYGAATADDDLEVDALGPRLFGDLGGLGEELCPDPFVGEAVDRLPAVPPRFNEVLVDALDSFFADELTRGGRGR